MKSRKVVLAVVLSLALISIALVAGAVALLLVDKQVPGALWSLAGVSVGSLATMLTSTSSTVAKTEIDPALLAAAVPTVITNFSGPTGAGPTGATGAVPLAGKLPS